MTIIQLLLFFLHQIVPIHCESLEVGTNVTLYCESLQVELVCVEPKTSTKEDFLVNFFYQLQKCAGLQQNYWEEKESREAMVVQGELTFINVNIINLYLSFAIYQCYIFGRGIEVVFIIVRDRFGPDKDRIWLVT